MSKIAPHTIELAELQDFVQKEYVTFASSTRENKRLYITLQGTYIVVAAGKTVYQGMQPFPAVEAYNAITEKYIDPAKNFKL